MSEIGFKILPIAIVFLFMTGIIIMIFSLFGGELQESVNDTTTSNIINDTTQSLSETTDWFPVFITIVASVFIISFVTIIIKSITETQSDTSA